MKKEIEEEILSYMRSVGADKFRKEGEWNGYEVYGPDGDERLIIGPFAVLVKGDEVREMETDEFYEWNRRDPFYEFLKEDSAVAPARRGKKTAVPKDRLVAVTLNKDVFRLKPESYTVARYITDPTSGEEVLPEAVRALEKGKKGADTRRRLAVLEGDTWEEFATVIIDKLRVGEWKREYVDKTALDGTQWSVIFETSPLSPRPSAINGSNAYPPRYKDFEKLMKDVCDYFGESEKD